MRCKSKWSAASFQYISIALNLIYNQNKLYKTSDYWPRDILNFEFLEKGLGLVSPPHFVCDFSRKMFLMLHAINWPKSLSDCLYFLRYWAICVLQLFVSQIVTSEILESIKPFFYITKKSRQKLNILRTKRAFKVK